MGTVPRSSSDEISAFSLSRGTGLLIAFRPAGHHFLQRPQPRAQEAIRYSVFGSSWTRSSITRSSDLD